MSGGVPLHEVSYDLVCLLSLLLPGGLFAQRAVVSCGRRAPAPAVQMASAVSWRASRSRRRHRQGRRTSFLGQRVPWACISCGVPPVRPPICYAIGPSLALLSVPCHL